MQTVHNASIQCDLHRRLDEAERCRVANRAERQSKLNRAEWERRAAEHYAAGIAHRNVAMKAATPEGVRHASELAREQLQIAHNICTRIAEHDRHGWKH